eukprot:TRINITY_DN14304_c0_g2_i1.p1 TRINITY_DN14304_c0_g2~~TRINITY_DN14304_c0_g2_i1.p1  ORF type:complete len:309 (+),score=44.36 TRINITY_DN14304_c0_g2_i1:72-929(+)
MTFVQTTSVCFLPTLPTTKPNPYPRLPIKQQKIRLITRSLDQKQQQQLNTTTLAKEERVEIEGLQEQYCDDFVCSSGPAVEQNIRALQRDIGRGEWSLNKFSQNVRYSDGFRRFTGQDCYLRNNWAKECVENYYARVDRVQMTGLNTALVDWIMSGKLGPVDIKVTFQDTFVLNPLTGRVEKHESKWDLNYCTLSGRFLFLASRLSWSLKQSSKDTQQQIGKVADALSSFDGDDEDEQDIKSMMDPTRMFQNSQRAQQNEEIFVFIFAVAIFYLIYVAAKTIYFG